MQGVRKSFPGVVAVDGVDLGVAKGEIRGLLGENGAGKTTLMKILYGMVAPDSGKIYLSGNEVHIRSPYDAIANQIGMVHQHFTLVPPLSVLENVILGLEPVTNGMLDLTKARKQLEVLFTSTSLPVDPDAPVEQLPVGLQQRVEILKALFRGAKLLILDEPTSVLTPLETRDLFQTLSRLKQQGTTIIFITHKLKEAVGICDRITVMRKGKITGTLGQSEATFDELARLMIGRSVLKAFEKTASSTDAVLLECRDLWVEGEAKKDAVKGVSVLVRAGEILGIAGVEGNGQTELVEAIMGLRKTRAGTVHVKGTVRSNVRPLDMINSGVAHIPENRHERGLILDFMILENTLLGSQFRDEFSTRGMLSRHRVLEFANSVVRVFNIITPSIRVITKNLSGGNQQRLVAGRELSRRPDLIIAAQPTRGLDLAGTEYIQSLLVQARNEGKGVLLVSADLDEVLSLSDRIVVMYEGRIAGESRASEATEETIGKLMGGVRL